ncbi:MAG: hypothetical protein J6C33_03785 [Lachnospiraceae bacterium]|nr:hypothetical protein [Lachnospiraceae bacterium]
MKRFKGVRGTIVLLILMCMLVGYYFYLSNRSGTVKEEPEESSQTQEVLLRDLSRNYPATPKEVVKYYSEITKCFYNEEYSEDELAQLADKAMQLYDEELVAYQAESAYLGELKNDIALWKEEEVKVSSYKTASSTDVTYFTKDGRECASILCAYTLRKGTVLQQLEELYILRRDDDGHWKILGWQEADPMMNQKIENED